MLHKLAVALAVKAVKTSPLTPHQASIMRQMNNYYLYYLLADMTNLLVTAISVKFTKFNFINEKH